MSVNLNPVADHIETYRQASAEIAKWKEVQEAAREKIERAMGEDEVGVLNGMVVVTWPHYDEQRLDTKQLRASIPAEVLAPYTNTNTRRRFTVED